MISVPSTEFSKNFGRYRELVQREPVEVTAHERVTGYFVSNADYEEYMRLKTLAAKPLAIEELSEATLQALAGVRMDARHDHLNSLLDD